MDAVLYIAYTSASGRACSGALHVHYMHALHRVHVHYMHALHRVHISHYMQRDWQLCAKPRTLAVVLKAAYMPLAVSTCR